jgi:hypothetical protein
MKKMEIKLIIRYAIIFAMMLALAAIRVYAGKGQ